MKKTALRLFATVLILILTAATLGGCGSKTSTSAKENNEVKKIKVHVSQGPAPYLYVKDDGTPDGYDFAVFKAAIDRLPDYEAEFISASDGLTGVLSGLYDVTVGNWVWRIDSDALTDELAQRLSWLSDTYGRLED